MGSDLFLGLVHLLPGTWTNLQFSGRIFRSQSYSALSHTMPYYAILILLFPTAALELFHIHVISMYISLQFNAIQCNLYQFILRHPSLILHQVGKCTMRHGPKNNKPSYHHVYREPTLGFEWGWVGTSSSHFKEDSSDIEQSF